MVGLVALVTPAIRPLRPPLGVERVVRVVAGSNRPTVIISSTALTPIIIVTSAAMGGDSVKAVFSAGWDVGIADTVARVVALGYGSPVGSLPFIFKALW